MRWMTGSTLLVLLLVSAAYGDPGEYVYGVYQVSPTVGIQLNEYQEYITLDMPMYSYIWHMDADRFIPGNILFAFDSALNTTNGNDTTSVAGSFLGHGGYANGNASVARFNYSTGFLQLDSGRVLIADALNRCIRYLDRVNETVSDFSGQCQVDVPSADGIGDEVRFHYPTSIIQDRRDPDHAIICDYNSTAAVRRLNIKTKQVTTLTTYTTQGSDSSSVQWEEGTDDCVLIVRITSVIRFNLTSLSQTDVFQLDYGVGYGTFDCAKFRHLFDVESLHPTGVYVGTDPAAEQMTLIDVTNEKVSPFCTKSEKPPDCHTYGIPTSLYQNGTTLYVATRSTRTSVTIKYLTVELIIVVPLELPETPGDEEPTSTASTLQDEKRGGNTGFRVAVVLLAVLCVILAGLLLWSRRDRRWFSLNRTTSQTNGDQAAVQYNQFKNETS